MPLPTLVRYFDLSGAVDADPLIAQPAADAFGPLTTGFGGTILINAWEVDTEGSKVAPTPGLDMTISVVTVSTVTAARPSGASSATEVTNELWGRGPQSVTVNPGEWQIQAELGEVVGFTVVITAKTGTPASRLAIFAARGPRS